MPKTALSEFAVFSGRKELVEAIKSAVKSLKLKNVRVESSSELQKFLGMIKDRRGICVVIDLERGVIPCIKLLKDESKIENRHSRPSLLFALEISDHVVEMATEYMVTQVHSGPLSEGSVKMTLEELVQEVDSISDIQEQLSQVSIAREQDEWEDAMEILEDLRKSNPDNLRVATEIAENLMHFDKWKEAYEVLEPILSAGGKDPRMMNMIGRCLLKLNKPEEASKVMGAAHLLNPYNVDRLLELGHLYLDLDKTKEAREKFEEAMDLEPDNKEAGKAVAQSCLLDGEINEGLKLLRQVANKRELASVFNTAGILCVRKKQIDKAIALYDAAIKALEGDERVRAKLYFNAGVAHFRTGKDKIALGFFERAIQADSSMTKARHNAVLLGSTVVKDDGSGASAKAAGEPIQMVDDLDEEDEFL